MSIIRLALLLISISLIALGCADVDVYGQALSDNSEDDCCQSDKLEHRAQQFLEDVVTGDIDKIGTYFHSQLEPAELDSRIAYTFFPSRDQNAIFDVVEKNEQSEFVTYVLGDYEHGKLVAYVQESKQDRITDVEFLKESRFDSYFVCLFICASREWVLATQACFEETDEPFGY